VTKALEPINATNPLLNNIGPVLLSEAASFMARGATLADAGLDVMQAAAGATEIIDIGIVMALVAQGLPTRLFTSAYGGEALLLMVETGVATEMLQRGNLVKEMVNKRILEQMIDLQLLDGALARPAIVKALIKDDVLGGLVQNGVLEAMLNTGNTQVLSSLLDSDMLEALVETRLMTATMRLGDVSTAKSR